MQKFDDLMYLRYLIIAILLLAGLSGDKIVELF